MEKGESSNMDSEREAALSQSPKQVLEAEKVPRKLPSVADTAVLPKPTKNLQFAVDGKDLETLKKKLPKFVFVYDLGSTFTSDLLQMPLKWWNEPYAGEEFFFHLLHDHGLARTTDPNKADLFYVPLFLSRFIMVKRSEGVLSHEAIRGASQMFEHGVMKKVRGYFPWFNRTSGRDHFSVIAADHGRCSLLTFVSRREVHGDMFFLQYNGDLLVRSNHVDERKQMHTLAFNPIRSKAEDVPEVACYAPSLDILIPPFISPSLPLVAPTAVDRNVTVLFRFGKYYAREEAQAVFFNHPIRIELYNLYSDLQVPRWSFGPRPRKETLLDSTHSVFCVSPPGHAQWTSRASLAILKGCIPVTFTRQHHSAFQSDLDYTSFTVNVDPDDLPLMKRRLDRIFRRKTVLEAMQKALAAAQMAFSWDPVFLNGAISRTMDALVARACQVSASKPRSGLTCLASKA